MHVPGSIRSTVAGHSYEGDRNSDATARQAMFFVSSDTLQWKIAGGQRIQQWLAAQKTDAEIIDEIYLAALSRLPTDKRGRKPPSI